MSLFHFKRKYQAMLEDGEGETSNPVKKENNPHPDPKPTVDEASNAQANVEPNPHPRDLMAKNEFLDVLRLVKREQSELEKIANDKIKMKRILSMEIESLQKQLKEMKRTRKVRACSLKASK
ncbi:uncharacterized protein LOC128997744 isoform X2 [Macrosteles quadrilineatus]|uniref:uncharacterized protein LOC128997744 isoform X2 n=1 Tax=Macrosteles quadrilineatus TaxID=74068 RepID=UPI0023E20403|nr:uncharacterized protein LOC128997744 isoform X2 [Macrosteles quadrilineatus]